MLLVPEPLREDVDTTANASAERSIVAWMKP
jgi:hypothetical protein